MDGTVTPRQTRGERKLPRLSTGMALICCLVVSVLVAITLAFSTSRVNLRVTALACVVACLVSGLAVLGVHRSRRWRSLVYILILSPVVVLAGALAWRIREFNSRNPALSAALDLASMPRGLVDYFSARPAKKLATLPPLPSTEKAEIASLALDSSYRFLDFPALRLSENLAWDEDPLKDRTWQWGLHTLPAVPALAEAYEQGQDLRYIAKAESLVLDWIADNQLYWIAAPSPFSWHDHVMALRVRGWLPFWETWIRSPLATASKAERILSSMVLHGERLADTQFYNEGHNHGMEQDFALIAIATAFPELKQAAAWRALAARRLQAQVDTVISPNGVQLEHTPYYHVFTLEILSDAQEFARQVGVTRQELNLDPVLIKMARFTANILQPDGTLPPVGDTPRDPPLQLDHRVLRQFVEKDPVLSFTLTRGSEGAPPARSVFYKEEGYAVFRDPWEPGKDYSQSFYLLFTAAANQGRVHKQHDDLSFVLFARGRELLADAGFHSNQYGDPEREYVTSTAAHNSVLVDGKGFTGWTAKIDETLDGPGYSLVQGSHSNYPGLIHRRTILYVRPATIFVFDELKARDAGEATRHDFELLHHFGPDLVPTLDGKGHSLLVNEPGTENALLFLEALAGGRGTVAAWSGSKAPFRGWRAVGHRQLVPASCVAFRETGAGVLFVTRIEVLDASPEISARQRQPAQLSLEAESGFIMLEWPAATGQRAARIRLQAPVEIRL